MLTKWRQALLDLIYPPKCPVCRAAVDSHGAWCKPCLTAVMAPRALSTALLNLHWLDECYTVCHYTGGLKTILHNVKFRQARWYAPALRWLLIQGGLDGRIFRAAAVVPVPLHQSRQAERGYNQTELIFRPWAQEHRLMWCDALVRTRATIPQWELTLKARRRNIKGAFAVTRRELVAGKAILLVDDILTSGLTMDECARMLKAAGAVRVTGLTLASGAR